MFPYRKNPLQDALFEVVGYLAVAIFLGSYSEGKAQEALKINGYIYDSLNQSPIEYANIHLSNRYVGTYSNMSGYFELNLPHEFSRDSLTISHVGYKSNVCLIARVANDDTVYIALEPASFVLDDVEVLGENDSISAIVDEALNKISLNYPIKQHLYTGFFRYLELQNEKYVRLIEAAVSVHDFGYTTITKDPKTRIQINELRKSDFFGESSFVGKLFQLMFGRNQIYDLYYKNWLSQFPALDASLKYRFNDTFTTKRHNFELIGEIKTDSSEIYIINYELNLVKAPGSSTMLVPYGTILINKADLGIILLEECFGTREKITENVFKKHLYDGQNKSKFTVSFRKYHGKYYIKTIESFTWDGAERFNFSSLFMNDLAENKKDFRRIKRKSQLKEEIDINDVHFSYDSTFWVNYNMVHENLLDPKVKGDLQERMSLESQFVKNSVNSKGLFRRKRKG